MRTRVQILLACTPLLACASSPTPPATPSAPTTDPSAAAATTGTPTPAASATAPPTEEAYDDPGELSDPTNMKPLFDKSSKPSFPKPTVSEATCWQSVSLSGNAPKDYEQLAAKCGTPTGSVAYTQPASGKLHYQKDKRDTFSLHLVGGLCYRFFGVADGTVKDLDLLIEQKSGALVGDDKANGPVAIIESAKSWCMDNDVDYQFNVEVDGTGTGHYVFGVWARPK
ncbi:MAG TPA: hypothetical protein VMI75_11125 [Polyangiaceae bacterium]|nr:hypothetical protein [Polyangiaceae bacterium]